MSGSSVSQAAAVWFDPQLRASIALLEAGTRATEMWFAWQHAVWQPLIDMQLQGGQCWLEAVNGLASGLWTQRGAEQLA